MPDRDADAQQEALASDASVHDRPNQPTAIATENELSQKIGASQEGDDLTRPDCEFTAVQQQQEKPEDVQSIARRKHGRALPKS
jgi:hypothetical protein